MQAYLTDHQAMRFSRFTFVLGAGASYSHGYPLVRDFLSSSYYEWLCDQAAGIPTQCAELNYFLGEVDRYRAVAGDFESVLSELNGKPEYFDAVTFVYRSLAAAYSITLSSTVGSTGEYMGLAAMLLQHPVPGGASIITFNYDTACEDALSAFSRALGGKVAGDRLFFRYGFQRLPTKAMPAKALNVASNAPITCPDGGPLVLKLHGSINLLICPECASILYFPVQVLADVPGAWLPPQCPECQKDVLLQPLVVPPGKRKDMPAALRELWTSAEEVLQNAQAVVIAGYSIPAYDLEARDILGRYLRGKAVVVIDPKPSDETLGFLRGIPEIDLHVEYRTFDEFLKLETERYEPSLIPYFAPHCEPIYLDSHRMRGLTR